MWARARVDNMSLLETYYLGLASKTNFVLRSILYQKCVAVCWGPSQQLFVKASLCGLKPQGAELLLVNFVIPTDCCARLTCRAREQSACLCDCRRQLTCRDMNNHVCTLAN